MLKALGLVKPRKQAVSISMSRALAVELMAYDIPDWAYQLLGLAVRKYDQRTQRPGGA
jgi:hypothetical protein